ncbi:hypothetical protein A3J90_00635 [candidate division WOR-1 bacterium RIFOXYC2_FULL_37_10]|uniref:Uncharacterized protein n=1 Tax=candidate division WOR-1 bacterium RIFOXYB2_FULL_37_13 TaxID=1802579 RepID=A0A1F4SKV4_UNCSA|nr:MAG: hypothetical protein A2310_00610 [candidate division WOR-1 bacterium RIFOXYB2_FULL_37_13]OGC36691.1 MAG: hypothetical protein A3J90_00635 [candidate division WOR-1 bacterium RIFOXYC2_FULL_37_10]
MSIKQSELNKQVNEALKKAAKLFSWSFSRGFLFCKKGDLFFYVYISSIKNIKKLALSLYYKWYDFDNVFWDILDLQENKKKPLSFHAAGVWTMPGMIIFEQNIDVYEWEGFNFSAQVLDTVKKINNISDDIASKIKNIDDNIIYVRKLFEQLTAGFPKTTINIDKEELITKIIKKEYASAKNLVETCLAKNDSGGFTKNGKNFYQMAQNFLVL